MNPEYKSAKFHNALFFLFFFLTPNANFIRTWDTQKIAKIVLLIEIGLCSIAARFRNSDAMFEKFYMGVIFRYVLASL